MSTTRIFLLASSLSLGLGGPYLAHAQSPLVKLPKWEVQVQGGFLLHQQFSPPVAADVLNLTESGATPQGSESISARNNGTGGITLRRRLSEGIDLGLGYTGIASAGNNHNFSSATNLFVLPGTITSPASTAAGGNDLAARTTATQHIADLDAGYLIGLSTASSLKLIGGVRFTQFNQNTNSNIVNAIFPIPGDFSHRREDSFIGAGPRLGALFSHALGKGFSFNAGVNGSVLAGEQKISTSTSGLNGTATGTFNQSHARVVYNAGAELSLAHNWSENLTASVGYQASAWFGLRNNRREVDAAASIAAGTDGTFFVAGGERRPIDLYHGPFLRLSYRF